MYKGSNCDRKSQLSEILTELLNPRGTNRGDIGEEGKNNEGCMFDQ